MKSLASMSETEQLVLARDAEGYGIAPSFVCIYGSPSVWAAKNSKGEYMYYFTYDGEGHNPRYELLTASTKEALEETIADIQDTIHDSGKHQEAEEVNSFEVVRL